MARLLILFAALAAALLLSGCATTGGATFAGSGVVQSIQEVQTPSQSSQIVGAVGGALVGAWLGSNIGGGSGATIASAVGGVGGSMAGSRVAGNASMTTVFDVSILFEDGITRTVRVDQRPAVRPGARVQVSNGQIISI